MGTDRGAGDDATQWKTTISRYVGPDGWLAFPRKAFTVKTNSSSSHKILESISGLGSVQEERDFVGKSKWKTAKKVENGIFTFFHFFWIDTFRYV